MRQTWVLALAMLAALGACERKPGNAPRAPAAPGSGPAGSAQPAAQPGAMPQRAAGLWEQTISTAGMNQTRQVCLDKAVEERFTVWGQQAGQGECAQTKVTPRPGGGWEFASTCDMGEGGRMATQGSVSGDFAKAYKVTAQSTTTGAAAPQMNGTHSMTLQATWKGPCPAGMAPGDMVLPGGMKINMMKIPTG